MKADGDAGEAISRLIMQRRVADHDADHVALASFEKFYEQRPQTWSNKPHVGAFVTPTGTELNHRVLFV